MFRRRWSAALYSSRLCRRLKAALPVPSLFRRSVRQCCSPFQGRKESADMVRVSQSGSNREKSSSVGLVHLLQCSSWELPEQSRTVKVHLERCDFSVRQNRSKRL